MGEWGADSGMVMMEGDDGRRNAFVDDVERKVAMTVASVVLVIDAIMFKVSIRFYSKIDGWVYASSSNLPTNIESVSVKAVGRSVLKLLPAPIIHHCGKWKEELR